MQRRLEKLSKFCDFARSLAELSPCTRRQNAAIIFSDDFREIYSIGYNGPPVKMPNNSCMFDNCTCAHAEINAIIKMGMMGGIMFTTKSPCIICANAILNCQKIHTVIYDKEHRDLSGLELIKMAGLIVCKYSEIMVI